MSSLHRIIWIGSYPKSGNTWVRAFLGNFFIPKDQKLSINELYNITTSDVRADWYDRAAGGIYAGVTADDALKLRPKVLQMIAASKPGHHFVKTHFKLGRTSQADYIPSEVTAAAIYIIRNPFDVAISYARHTSTSVDIAIDRMSDPLCANIGQKNIIEVLGRWDNHIQSWTKAPGLARHVMRYEDMVVNPKVAFKGMLNFLQVPIQNKMLRRALEESSFKAMQKQEENLGFREKPVEAEKFFVSGKAGGWVDVLTQAQVSRILSEFEATIEEYFPEIGEQARMFIAQS